jgi:Fe/S biogenesis protein NfuA
MITFTDAARAEFEKVIADAGPDTKGIRVRAAKLGRHTFRYQLLLVREDEIEENDEMVEVGSFKAYLDPETSEWMKEATVNFVTEGGDTGFDINNPGAEVKWDDPLAQKVQEVLDKQVTPALAGHGGWCELIDVKDDTARVQLGGGCQGCAGARATLKQGIEVMITREVPEIKTVIDETDHDSGHNPFM